MLKNVMGASYFLIEQKIEIWIGCDCTIQGVLRNYTYVYLYTQWFAEHYNLAFEHVFRRRVFLETHRPMVSKLDRSADTEKEKNVLHL